MNLPILIKKTIQVKAHQRLNPETGQVEQVEAFTREDNRTKAQEDPTKIKGTPVLPIKQKKFVNDFIDFDDPSLYAEDERDPVKQFASEISNGKSNEEIFDKLDRDHDKILRDMTQTPEQSRIENEFNKVMNNEHLVNMLREYKIAPDTTPVYIMKALAAEAFANIPHKDYDPVNKYIKEIKDKYSATPVRDADQLRSW